MSTVTVIVPVFNGELTIVDCVESLILNINEISELIFIDDASTDKTPALLKKIKHPKITIITNNMRLGPAKSRNIGLARSTSELIFFTDADCTVDPDWINVGLKRLEQAGVVGVEGRTVYSIINPGFLHQIPINPFYHQGTIHTISKPNQDYAAANIAFKRQYLIQSNGFDSIRFNNGREDTDLAWRIKKHGKILYCPEMIVTHKDSIWTLSGLLRNSRRYENDVTFLKCHGFFFFKKAFILHPQFLLMLIFPPLLFKKHKIKTKREIKFAFSFYLYLIFVRLNIWRGAIKSRVFVI